MKRTLFRIALVAAALAYLAVLSVNFVGAWFLRLPTIKNVNRGVRWNPGNPSFWTGYARYWLYAGEGAESGRAIDGFLRAAASNPFDPANWDGLATAYFQMQDPRKAEAALRARLVATPHSPDGAWRLGNFLLVVDRPEEAFPYLKAAASTVRELRLPLYDMAWKISGDPDAILRDLVPSSLEAREDYLRFLIQRKKSLEAYEVWKEIRPSHGKEVLELGYFFVDALITTGAAAEAAKVWQELLEDTGRSRAKPPGELLTNGDFEAGLPDVGLDWRLTPGPGYQTGLDLFVVQNGAHSLRVVFDGATNPEFDGVWQTVPVEPGRDYRLRAFVKTDNITTDNGIQVAVWPVGVEPAERFVALTDNTLGSNPWSLQQLDFRTGPKTHIVQVVLHRTPSKKLNNLIQGKVWIDNLSLKPRP